MVAPPTAGKHIIELVLLCCIGLHDSLDSSPVWNLVCCFFIVLLWMCTVAFAPTSVHTTNLVPELMGWHAEHRSMGTLPFLCPEPRAVLCPVPQPARHRDTHKLVKLK